MKQKISIALTFFAVGTFFLVRWSTGWPAGAAASALEAGQQSRVVQPSQRPGDRRQSVEQQVEVQRNSVLQSQRKPNVPVAPDLDISAMNVQVTADELNHSMKLRRDYAWNIVKKVWKPVNVPGGKIPTWMTWYEQEDIAELYKEMISLPKLPTPTAISARVTALPRSRSTKNLQTSLVSARLGKVLRQFTFRESLNSGPNKKPSTGNIYYSPAYVKHLLENASNIAKCDPSAFPNPSATSLRQRPGAMGIEDVPAALRPEDPNNLYALCMDHEMPPEAVMIKVAWTPVIIAENSFGGQDEYARVHLFDLGTKMAPKLSTPPAGQWIDQGTANGNYGFQVTDEQSQKWQLVGMHIASKRLRTWLWISLFTLGFDWVLDRSPSGSFDTDFGASLTDYGMCVVSDFKESDPAPWSHYVGLLWNGKPNPRLADVIKAVSQVMNGAQWCANPYIETNMSRGNCIGCHQGSTESFLPRTLIERQHFNLSDFSFSFATNRAMIKDLMPGAGVHRRCSSRTSLLQAAIRSQRWVSARLL